MSHLEIERLDARLKSLAGALRVAIDPIQADVIEMRMDDILDQRNAAEARIRAELAERAVHEYLSETVGDDEHVIKGQD